MGYRCDSRDEITHPNALDVLGRAPSDVSVTVNEQPVTRQGEFWRREVGDLPNALAAVWQPVQVHAVDPGAGPNGADVPARRSGHRFVPMASETPFYDFDGNLVSDARWIYVWNGENQLIEMTTAAPALAAGVPRERYRFVYDSRSRRIARTAESWDLDTGAWVLEKNERFIHDDWNVVAVVDAAGTILRRYVWGNDLSSTPQGAGGVGGLLAAADAASGRSWCYAYDGNGNVSAVVDLADGAKVGRYDYDAFGRTIASWGDEGLAGVNPYRFSTKPLEGTGLYYYGFRYYQPEMGRFLNRDPIAENGGENLYAFVKNEPITTLDFLGLVGPRDDPASFYPDRGGYSITDWDGKYKTFHGASTAYTESELCACIEYQFTNSAPFMASWGSVVEGHKPITDGGNASLGFGERESFFGTSTYQMNISVAGKWKTETLPVPNRSIGLCCNALRAFHEKNSRYQIDMVLRTTDPVKGDPWIIQQLINPSHTLKFKETVVSRLPIGAVGPGFGRLNQFAGSEFTAEVWIAEPYSSSKFRCKKPIRFSTDRSRPSLNKIEYPPL